MGLFKTNENRVICGRCKTEFDLIKNNEHCPLCGFGKEYMINKEIEFVTIEKYPKKEIIEISSKPNFEKNIDEKYLKIPSHLELESGEIMADEETKVWGHWLMFNDFFAPKFLTRVLGWKMHESGADYIKLDELMIDSIRLIKNHKLSSLKGFPNLQNDSEGGRLVNHFLRTFNKMGLVKVKSIDSTTNDVWKEKWNKIEVALTKEGLEFARLSNPLFDEGKEEQILSSEEKQWILNHLKRIDREGYKEYSILSEVYEFLKSGKNGNKDLRTWFENDKKFQNYIKKRSVRARDNPKIYEKQLRNYARTFASAKVSLLRELGLVKNKRNDYTIMRELK